MRRLAFLGTLALLPAVFACGDDGDGPGGGGGQAAAGGTGGQGGGPLPCTIVTDCPLPPAQCVERTCDAGACGTKPVAVGIPTTTQALEDCQRTECDGAGTTQSVPDDDDVDDDLNPCTVDSCSGGTAVHDPLPVGTPCDESGLCDARGACVDCLGNADCGVPTECSTPTCDDGTCTAVHTDAGTPLTVQVPGDCMATVCDGAGMTMPQIDDSDIPEDNNVCTVDTCDSGTTMNLPQPGQPCGASGVCDDMGQCVGCSAPEDCPGTDDFCKTRTCTNDVCGFSYTMAGTELPPPSQTAGDCVTLVCDGMGIIHPVVEATDVLVDGNECTQDLCVGGAPQNPPESPATPCAMGTSVCDGMGSCVDCLTSADCMDPPGFPCELATCTQGMCGAADAPSGTSCGAGSCSGGVEQLPDTCNGMGDCIDGGSVMCAPYVCGGISCTTSCLDDAGCAGGFSCDTGLQVCTNGPKCTDYCNTIEAACTSSLDQYGSMAWCLAACSALPPGTASDTSGNTVGCRSYHASVAASVPNPHCYHAGPGGGGACGADCDGFCTIAMDACTGNDQVYASFAACTAECQGFPTSPAYSASVTSGDSFACRMYHLTAATTDPATHCPHIVEASPTCQ